ncbi:MAG: hypothetical protein NTX25_13960, partial [Proteobacteria bacterium]|nr:hypothetical protein [Pseudomonadota bacterium]
MKSLTTLALSTGLMFTPLVISTVSASSAVYADAHSDELREAAGALAYRAGLARDVLLDLSRESPATDIAKASRLALAIRSMALDLEAQLDSRDDSVQQTLDEIEAK